jgi:hypothetical protein
MGTYRQPSQLIDKSFEKLNQGFAQLGQQMQAQLAAKQKAKLQAAQDAAKKRDREYAAFDKKRDKAVMDYQVKIDNWEHINQERGDDWEAEDVTIENQLKDNANHYLDIMGSAQEDSTEYRTAERALRNMIEQYPTMAGLLNQESEELAGAYNPTGEDRLADDKAGAVLLSNDPLASTKTHMLHDIKFSRHPERFKIITGPTGVTMTYNDPDTGETFTLDAAEYKMYKEGGNDLVGVTNEEDFNKFMDGVWDIAGNDYKPFKEKLMQYRKDKASGKDVKITEVTKTYDRANATLKANIEKYVKGNGTITQSQWQLMGGSKIPGMEVYDPANEEMQQKAIDLLYQKQLDKYGKDAENNFTAQELKQKKIEKDEKVEALKTGGFEIKNVPGLTGGTHSYTEVKDAYTNAPDKTAYTVALLNNAMNQDGLNGNYITGAQLIQSAKDQGVEGEDLAELEASIESQGGANAIFQPGSEKEGYIKQDINAWTDVRGRLGRLKGFDKDAMMQLDGNVEAAEENTPFKIIDLSQRQGGKPAPIKDDMQEPKEEPEVKDGTVVDTTEKVEEKVQDADVDEVFGVEEEVEELPETSAYMSERIKAQGGEDKLANPVLKEDLGDGKDYLRNMLNFENTMGNFSGNSVANYGFSGTGPKGGKLLELYNKEKGSAEEKALSTIDKFIIGSGPDQEDVGGGNKTILQDLNMSREDFDKLPEDVRRQLVDWKFNSGRGTTDLIAIAGGADWDGKKAFQKNSPTVEFIEKIDISKLTPESLKKARQELYKGRVDGLKNMKGKESEYKAALKGYNNSQKYR